MTVARGRIGTTGRAPVLGRAMPLAMVLTALASCAPTIVPDPGGRRPVAAPPPVQRPRPQARPSWQQPSQPRPPVSYSAPSTVPFAPSVGDTDWLDWPLTPGTWTYAHSAASTVAHFGTGGVVQAWVRCDLANRSVAVGRATRAGEPTSMMSVRTTFGTVEWPARAVSAPVAGMEAVRGASDPGLDQIAFSRGRFALMLKGPSPVVAPSWAEPVRVIEDCRG